MKLTAATAVILLASSANATSYFYGPKCSRNINASSTENEILQCIPECATAKNFVTLASNIKKHDLYNRVKLDALKKIMNEPAGRTAFASIIENISATTVEGAIATNDKWVDEMLAARKDYPDYYWVPIHYFNKSENVRTLFNHYAKTKHPLQQFLARLSTRAFGKIQSFPEFHGGRLTSEALNHLVDSSLDKKRREAFLKALKTSKMTFINSLYAVKNGDQAAALEKKIIENLPENFLDSLEKKPNSADAKYFTTVQASKAKKLAKGIDMDEAKKSTIRALGHTKAIKRTAKGASEETLSKFTADQWNKLFKESKHCSLLKTTKIDNVSKIDFSAECFANIPTDIQTYVLTKHTNLKDDVLSQVTKSMTDQWFLEKSNASNLEVLNRIVSKNKAAIIGNLGAHENVDDEEHPCYEMSLSDVKEIKSLAENISSKAVNVLNIGEVTKSDLKEYAEILAKKEGIFQLIDDMNSNLDSSKPKDVKNNVWALMDKTTLGKLASAGNELAKDMTHEVFTLIPADRRAELKGKFIAQLSFLKDLTQADYATLGQNAFDFITKAQANLVRIADMSDAQLSNLSMAVSDLSETFFASVLPADMKKLTIERLALLNARQWAAIQPAVFKAIFETAEAMSAIPATATTTWTSTQLKDISKKAIAAISAAQIEVMGKDVADAKLSATAFLVANKNLLNAEAKAALIARCPEASATRMVVSSAVAAVAALALLA